jgi:histidinol dehydrogenase
VTSASVPEASGDPFHTQEKRPLAHRVRIPGPASPSEKFVLTDRACQVDLTVVNSGSSA